MDSKMKICNRCNVEYALTEFYRGGSGEDGRINQCRACRKVYMAARYAQDPSKARDRQLRHDFGITLAEYNSMMEAQGGLCAICAQPPRGRWNFHVDHCHTKGNVRALLCKDCNLGLGLYKDSIPTLLAAVEYLKRYQV
jgi:hypothetical protein